MTSIYQSKKHIIPLADVAYIEFDRREHQEGCCIVIMNGTTWGQEADWYNNAPYILADEAEAFIQAWKAYREEADND